MLINYLALPECLVPCNSVVLRICTYTTSDWFIHSFVELRRPRKFSRRQTVCTFSWPSAA